MVQQSTLPEHLPPNAHLHLMNFILPINLVDGTGVFKLLREITGEHNPIVTKGYGRRYQYNEFFQLKNELNEVLLTVYIGGSGRFKNTTAVCINGLAFETWNSHNPLTLDITKLIQFVFDHKGHFTRIDLTKNDYRRAVDWKELVHCSKKEYFRDRLILKLNKTAPPMYIKQETESVYFGSSKSRTQILAYCKGEIGQTKFPWLRFEVKVRGRLQADNVAHMLLSGTDIEELTSGVLAYYLEFKESSILAKNKRPTCKWWTDFVGTAKIRLTPAKAETAGEIAADFDEFTF